MKNHDVLDFSTLYKEHWESIFRQIVNKDKNYLWPIPQKERDLNPGLTKNPNW